MRWPGRTPACRRLRLLQRQRPETVTLAALDDALAALKQAYGPDQAAWKVPAGPMVFAPKNFLGVPQADAKATLTYPVAQNRGTENNMTVFDGRTVRGGCGRAGAEASWRRTARCRRTPATSSTCTRASAASGWFTDAEVREHARSTETLRY